MAIEHLEPGQKPLAHTAVQQTARSNRRSIYAIVAATLLAIAVIVEWTTGICTGCGFDPLPNSVYIFGYFAVVAVLIFNEIVLRSEPGSQMEECNMLIAMASTSAALVMIVMAAVLFVIVVPLAVFAIIIGGSSVSHPGVFIMYVGLGVLGLSPYIGLLAVIIQFMVLRRRLRGIPAMAQRRRIGRWSLACGTLALVVLVLQPLVIGLLIGACVRRGPTAAWSVPLIRAAGGTQDLLRACYGQPLPLWVKTGAFGSYPSERGSQLLTNAELARVQAAYRTLSGSPYTAVTPPYVDPNAGNALGATD